jgi:hypothetical protein
MGVLHIILKVGHPKIISTQISVFSSETAEPNLTGMVLGWSPFNIVSNSPALHSKWLLLLKIEIYLVVNFHFITNQNELKFMDN